MKSLLVAAGCASALTLMGCASQEQIALQDDVSCTTAGYGVGTAEHDRCVLMLEEQRTASRQLAAARLFAAGAAMQAAGGGYGVAAASTTPVGFTKVCTYNTITGPRAITVSSVSICPLTPP